MEGIRYYTERIADQKPEIDNQERGITPLVKVVIEDVIIRL